MIFITEETSVYSAVRTGSFVLKLLIITLFDLELLLFIVLLTLPERFRGRGGAIF